MLGARNRLKVLVPLIMFSLTYCHSHSFWSQSATKAREQEQQQLHALIVERKTALERLRLECEALQKIETEQNDFIEQLILQQ